jgi:hypothetical protein
LYSQTNSGFFLHSFVYLPMEPTTITASTGVLTFLSKFLPFLRRSFHMQFGIEPSGVLGFGDLMDSDTYVYGGGTYHVVTITLLQPESHYIKQIGFTDNRSEEFILWEAKYNSEELPIDANNRSISQSVSISISAQRPIRYIWIKTRTGKTYKSKKHPDEPDIRPDTY